MKQQNSLQVMAIRKSVEIIVGTILLAALFDDICVYVYTLVLLPPTWKLRGKTRPYVTSVSRRMICYSRGSGRRRKLRLLRRLIPIPSARVNSTSKLAARHTWSGSINYSPSIQLSATCLQLASSFTVTTVGACLPASSYMFCPFNVTAVDTYRAALFQFTKRVRHLTRVSSKYISCNAYFRDYTSDL